MGIDDEVEVYISIVALKDFCLRLDGADNLLQMLQLLRLYFCRLVQQDDVAELHLLDNERCQVFLIDILLHQVGTVGKFIFHAEGIYHGNDAVEAQDAVLDVLRTERWDGADGLGDRSWLADTACLNYDIVEALHVYDFLQLLHEVHLQSAADATVLQGNERIVFLTYHATFLYQCRINVHLADIIYDDSELDTFLICQNLVEQGCLAAAQIACQKQDWNFFCVHTYIIC